MRILNLLLVAALMTMLVAPSASALAAKTVTEEFADLVIGPNAKYCVRTDAGCGGAWARVSVDYGPNIHVCVNTLFNEILC